MEAEGFALLCSLHMYAHTYVRELTRVKVQAPETPPKSSALQDMNSWLFTYRLSTRY